jgi:hypothetical protein
MKKTLKFSPWKPLPWLAPILFFFLISCSRHHENPVPPAVDCITRLPDTASQTSSVTPAQLNVILALFQHNNLPATGLKFVGIDSNIYEPPGYPDSISQVMVVAELFINGLPTFSPGGVAFYFYNGSYQTNLTHYGTASSTDTSAHQTLEDLRTIYLAHYQEDAITPPVADPPPPTHPGLNWRDSCLVAMFGYADASIFDSSITWGTEQVKTWWVAPVGQTYPAIYIEDDNGAWKTDNPILF